MRKKDKIVDGRVIIFGFVLGVVIMWSLQYLLDGPRRTVLTIPDGKGSGWYTEIHPAFPIEPEPETKTPPPEYNPYIIQRPKFIDAMLDTLIPSAHAAGHPAGSVEEGTLFAYPHKLKRWSIAQRSTETKHQACVASRDISQGLSISVIAPLKGNITLIIHGAKFEIPEHKMYGDAIVSVDGEVIVETGATRISDWHTSIDMSGMTLTKFAQGKTLRVTIGKFYLDLPLDESAKAAKAVAECNESGQSLTVRRRMDAAVPVTIR